MVYMPFLNSGYDWNYSLFPPVLRGEILFASPGATSASLGVRVLGLLAVQAVLLAVRLKTTQQ